MTRLRGVNRWKYFYQMVVCCKTIWDVEELWNWVDYQSDPELFWEEMGRCLPWAFIPGSNPGYFSSLVMPSV